MTVNRYRHITGAGDDGVVSAVPCTLVSLVVGSEAAGGTAAVHDCATEAEANASNLVSNVKLDTRTSVGFNVQMNAGLVVMVGGAPDITVVYG